MVLSSYLTIIMLFMLFGPALIIAFSKRVKRWKKVQWVIYALLPIVIVPLVVTIGVQIIIPSEIDMSGVNAGLIMPIPTYLSVWIVLFIFKSKNLPPSKQNKHTT